jgi:hypothetical protein
VEGSSNDPIIEGINSGFGIGVSGVSSGWGVYGNSNINYGVYGHSNSNFGVYGNSSSGYGVYGYSNGLGGVYGQSSSGNGVYGQSTSGYGVYGESSGHAIYGQADGSSGVGITGVANGSNGIGVKGHGAKWDFWADHAKYGNNSSIRWKNDIRLIDDPLGKVSAIRGVYFTWDEEHGGEHAVGMIAEEVGAVLPEIVCYEENGVDAKGMDYSKITPLLVEAVKALKTELDERDGKIANLEARLAAMETLLTESRPTDVQMLYRDMSLHEPGNGSSR